MFMEIAIGAIGIGIVLMVGYLVIAQVRNALPVPMVTNPCYGGPIVGSCTTNLTATVADASVLTGMNSTQTTVFAGFGLVAVGIIVLAAFGLINIFK